MSLRFGIRLKCSISLPERKGDLLRRVPETLHGMPLLPMCDHPTRLTLRLDQFSGSGQLEVQMWERVSITSLREI